MRAPSVLIAVEPRRDAPGTSRVHAFAPRIRLPSLPKRNEEKEEEQPTLWKLGRLPRHL